MMTKKELLQKLNDVKDNEEINILVIDSDLETELVAAILKVRRAEEDEDFVSDGILEKSDVLIEVKCI
jgi:hypothetical protein